MNYRMDVEQLFDLEQAAAYSAVDPRQKHPVITAQSLKICAFAILFQIIVHLMLFMGF